MPTTFGTEVGRGDGSGAPRHGDRHRPTLDQRRAARGILCDHGSRCRSDLTRTVAKVNPALCSAEIAACRSRPITDGTTSNWYEDGSVHTSSVGSAPEELDHVDIPGGVYGFASTPVTSTQRHVADVRRRTELHGQPSPQA